MSRFPTKTQREQYPEIVNFVSIRCGVSYRKVSTVLTEFARTVQDSIAEGNDVVIDALCKFSFVAKEDTIYKNSTLDLTNLTERVVNRLEQSVNLSMEDTRNIIFHYVQRVRQLIIMGQQVNLKGLCYIRLREFTEEDIGFELRRSGVLRKPLTASFYVLDTGGHPVMKTLTDAQLRLKLHLDASIPIPEKPIEMAPLKLKALDI